MNIAIPHEHYFKNKTIEVLPHGKSKKRFKDVLNIRVCKCGMQQTIDIKERKVF